ncbi:MAG: histidine phosphatase family protein [Pseudorhodoplanes sp.]|uniref:histidine phosphatase family protein n=1 Tax=Pseudorhodoplanes sp. TaxID=1934341 RepID=UPI003D0D9C8E
MIRNVRAFLFAFAILCGLAVPALALPKTVIILRHGEKENNFALCRIGIDRSLALAAQYLGQGAKQSLFATGERPAAFFAITLHTLELASPAAATWEMPVTTFSAVPLPRIDLTPQLNLRTQQAVGALMDDPRYDGKTVVMVWEHHHIADRRLERKFPDQKVTLRQLLNLDKLADVPETWPGRTYDYFWVVEYGTTGSRVPVSFRMVRQDFAAPFDKVPSNDWGKRAKLPLGNKCLP